MSLTLKDNIISALDDYAEYVLKSGFGGAIDQSEAVDFILESVENQGYMTGQEFYERFEKEWCSKPIILNNGFAETPEDWIAKIDARVKEAAKRASGLDN